MNHQGRRIKTGIPYYQEDRSYQGLERVIFKKILRSSEIRRIKRIFRSTYFPIKPDPPVTKILFFIIVLYFMCLYTSLMILLKL